MEGEPFEPAEPDDSPSAIAVVAASARPSRRRAVIGWSVGITAALVLGAVLAYGQVSANESFDAAGARLISATDNASVAEESLQEETEAVAKSLVSGNQIVAGADEALADAEAQSAFSAAVSAASDSAAGAVSLLDRDTDDGEFDKPFWMWELWDATATLEDRASAVDDTAAELTSHDVALQAAEQKMTDAALALYGSVPAKATAFEAANVSAVATTVLDFRDSAAAVSKLTGLTPAAAVAFSLLSTRADLLAASSTAELAEKAGPLYETRLEVEAYARSISGGIVLDFDWAPIVNEVGGDSGIGGLATWTSQRGGFTTITLSNSVAEWWSRGGDEAADSRALVTHEVGHAISGKCFEKFDWNSAEANEEWATAWAISMGQTADGNGVQAYGYPSQAMIDIAATCR